MTASAAELNAAQIILAKLGISAQQLLAEPADHKPIPTFRTYIPIVSNAVGDGTRRVYGSYWNMILAEWPDRGLDEPTPTEIKALAEKVKAGVVLRRNARGGRGAAEHLIAAIRCVYKHAENDKHIRADDNPASKVSKPRRLPSTRCAISDNRLGEINYVAASTGNDPELDTLVLRLHTETACRRGGALALRPQDLDVEQCLILLREKGETMRWQPVSPTLMRHLVEHAEQRGGGPDQQLLRYADGTPITTRRYDHIWVRLGRHLPWVEIQGVSTHWLRHTTLTWVERNFGYAVARAYAGHNDNTNDAGTTTTYIRATIEEIASALAVLTGEPHPLAASR
ncbi:site-specific integrase [Kutzneria sp. NPDC051319]|uniref:tyrosine-type recombinase/integrase n=1 Tax=Kutzneria sp. NPDC051319 TaxID=3155047 RepID=UPI0034453AE1